jgi:hypothetical protein
LQTIEKIKPKALITSWLTSVDQRFMQNYFKQLAEDAVGLQILAAGYQINTHFEELNLPKQVKQFKNTGELIKLIS